ncbi:hypothetical protein A9Q83_00205 [Alphaproteobacteria bacterium 46_93_T64]|nr:hypothetical protein A9Q83_00205 [Alphaproteobacteria bacterium 46_93_T64]
MNTLVIFEIILAVSALVSLVLIRRTYFPMNLFWAVGVLSIGGAAGLGAFVYGGFTDLKPYHSLASGFAGSVGIASFTVGAVGGIFSRQFHKAGWWIVLLAIATLSSVLLLDIWRLTEEVRYGVIGLLALSAIYRLFINAASGIFLVLGVAMLVIAGLSSGWLATQFGVEQLNIYHALLAVSMLSFGIFASKE